MSAATASRRAVVVLAVAAVAAIVGAGAAQAHSTLVSTDPADGSTVAVAPARVTLTFNEPARSLGTEIVVTAPDATTVSTGDPVVDGAVVSQDLTGVLPAGTYTVTWRVTSADGHPLEGVLAFTATAATTVGVAPAVTPAPNPTPTPTSAPTPTPSTPSTPAPSATASITSTAPAGGAEIGPVPDQVADGDDGTLSGVVVAAAAALALVLVVAATVLVRRRRARELRSRSTRA